MENQNVSGKRFLAVTLLNAGITVVEIIGGIFSGSLALLSDAFHNLGDSLSIIMSYFAQVISGRPENRRRTFGYRRAEIIAAWLNAIFLIVVAIFLIVEAIRRLSHPQHIKGGIMLIVAVIGLLANFASAALLHSGSHNSLNVKATYLHVLSDALASIAVMFGGLVLMFVNVPWLDPVLTIAVSLYVAKEAWPIIVQTTGILMQDSPKLNYKAIIRDIKKIDGVENVHHIHAWQMDEHRIVFSLHINCQDMMLSRVEKIYSQIERLLRKKYGVSHVTIQAECVRGRHEEIFNTKDDQKNICQ